MTLFPSPAAARAWARVWVDSAFLMADAASVIGQRTMRIMAGGRAAEDEAARMVAEKVSAGAELAAAIASGRAATPHAAARKAVSVARRHVRANRRRLG